MLNQYDHANKLRQSCENMQKCREAARQAAKRKRNRDQFDADPSVNTSATSSPSVNPNLQGNNVTASGGSAL
jgi:hypothetical protein